MLCIKIGCDLLAQLATGGPAQYPGALLPSLSTALPPCTVPGPPPAGPPPAFPQFSWEPWQQHARPVNPSGCSCCRPTEPCGPPRGSFQASNLVAAALDADALRTGAPRPCYRPPFPPSGCPGNECAADGHMGALPCVGSCSASRPGGLGPMEYPCPLGHFPPQPVVNAGGFARGKGKGKGKGKGFYGWQRRLLGRRGQVLCGPHCSGRHGC